MKVVISTLGSRGDIQPYLALAMALQQAGHRVTLSAPQTYAEWIQSYGVNVHPVRFNPQEVMHNISKRGSKLAAFREMRHLMDKGVMQALGDCWQAAQDADFMVQTGTGSNALEIASQRGIPVAFSYLVPMAPTRAFPSFFLPFRFSLGGGYNRLTYSLVSLALWLTVGGRTVNRWRSRLGLSPWRSESEMLNYARSLGTPSLYGFSQSVLPRPPDWDPYQHITGYWFLPAQPGWEPPADLLRFVESGPPPTYVGFGSMSSENPEHQARLAVRALELSGQRGVLATGWGGIAHIPVSSSILFTKDVPHEWLFPRMAAVVHHGGAGTTSAGLRAGIPSVITSFGGEQRAWADLVVKLGVGEHIPAMKSLTPEKLSQAIRTAVNDHALRSRAASLGAQIRAENGAARAVEVIEAHAAHFGQC